MSAQIIPFPRTRAQQTHGTPLELDPTFRAWCDRQNQRAMELDQPLPLRSELRARYVRQSRLVSAERTSPRKEDHVRPTRELFALKPAGLRRTGGRAHVEAVLDGDE